MSQAGFSLSDGVTRWSPASLRVAHGLAFVGSPIFAVMAWIAANDAPLALCSTGPSILPVDGMTAMYLLMSLFHLPPWLKLASAGGPASNR
jgi:hypothetical protein